MNVNIYISYLEFTAKNVHIFNCCFGVFLLVAGYLYEYGLGVDENRPKFGTVPLFSRATITEYRSSIFPLDTSIIERRESCVSRKYVRAQGKV